jgi:O-antigen/teichoic acid export membrane protein
MILPLFFGFFWGTQIVGFFIFAQRILLLPMSIIGNNIKQVFIPKVNKAIQEGTIDRITWDIYQSLLDVIIVPILLLIIIGPELFSISFGKEWDTAGIYLQWLAIYIFFQFISSPLSSIIVVKNKQNIDLIFQIIFFICKSCIIIVFGFNSDALSAIKAYSIISGIFYIIYSYIIFSLIKVKFQKCIYLIFKKILKAFPFCIIPFLMSMFYKNELIIVISGLAMGIIWLIYNSKRYLFK